VVYFSEAEAIEGANATSSGSNMVARSSNQQCGYADEDLTITQLPAGVYKATIIYYSNSSAGTTLYFDFGGTEYTATYGAASNWLTATKDFTLTSSSDIKWLKSGDNKNGLDFIYIQKTGDYGTTTLNTYGYATFSYASAVEISGATAYVASVNETAKTITLSAVTDNIVPANTGVVLKGDANATVSYTTTTTETTYSENALKAAVSAIDRPEGNIYVLSGNTFNPLDESVTTLTANRAYLVMSDTFDPATEAKYRIVTDETATAITAIEAEKMVNDGIIYNLNGQRVVKPLKGIYIQNGKKILVK
jgi:hypothetical protein